MTGLVKPTLPSPASASLSHPHFTRLVFPGADLCCCVSCFSSFVLPSGCYESCVNTRGQVRVSGQGPASSLEHHFQEVGETLNAVVSLR